MKIKTKEGIAKGFPLSDIQENNKWLKVLALSFALFVLFLIAFVLWLKFSGIGHNIIYELSPKNNVEPRNLGCFSSEFVDRVIKIYDSRIKQIISDCSIEKESGRYYHDMDYSKDKLIDYWNDMWAECEFGEKNYKAVRKEYSY